MVLDNIKNAAIYSGLGKPFDAAFAFLRKADLSTMPVGKYVVDDVSFSVWEYNTISPEQAHIEGHRRYADIQYVVAGEEYMGYCAKSAEMIGLGYDTEKDIEFFEGGCDMVRLRPGDFAILFPEDLHMPKCICGSTTPVKKIVVKVKV